LRCAGFDAFCRYASKQFSAALTVNMGKLPVNGIAGESRVEAPWTLGDEVIAALRQLP
jgi:hypothetical protein